MVFFKEFQKGTITILESANDPREHGTTLEVQPSLIGHYKLHVLHPESSIHLSQWSEETYCEVSNLAGSSQKHHSKYKALLLRSSLHDGRDVLDPFPLLGHKISATEAQWCASFRPIVELSYTEGYWEWVEEILGHHSSFLKEQRIYNAIFASLFTYDRHASVLKAFLESWCPMTNTLHTSFGEVSISLWDLREIGGLPFDGMFYDEVVPSADELSFVSCNGAPGLPLTCQYLFLAFHLLCKGVKGEPVVKISDWIQFWFKGEVKHKKPQKKKTKNKTQRPKKTYNPSGRIGPVYPCSSVEEAVCVLLKADKAMWDKIYLAAFLATWLCKFVLPIGNTNLMRPGVFKIASMMANGSLICLAVPVLANIYKGLNSIVSSLNPGNSNAVFPIHYVYGWLAEYFRTHFCAPDLQNQQPLMVRYSGEGGAQQFDDLEAQNLFKSYGSIVLDRLFMKVPKRQSLIDNDKISFHKFEYFASLRSSVLTTRHGGHLIFEPYSPHRFSRQFGFHQDVPGRLREDIRNGSLKDIITYWQLCVQCLTKKAVILPERTSLKEFSVTKAYLNWWLKVYNDPFSRPANVPAKGKRLVLADDNPAKAKKCSIGTNSSGVHHRLQSVSVEAEIEDRLSIKSDSDQCLKHVSGDKSRPFTLAGSLDALLCEGNFFTGVPSYSHAFDFNEAQLGSIPDLNGFLNGIGIADGPQSSIDSIQGPNYDLPIKKHQNTNAVDVTSVIQSKPNNGQVQCLMSSIPYRLPSGSGELHDFRRQVAFMLRNKMFSLLDKTTLDEVPLLKDMLEEFYKLFSCLGVDYFPIQKQIELYIKEVSKYQSLRSACDKKMTLAKQKERLTRIDHLIVEESSLEGQITEHMQHLHLNLVYVDSERNRLKKELENFEAHATTLRTSIEEGEAKVLQKKVAISGLRDERVAVEQALIVTEEKLQMENKLKEMLESMREDIKLQPWI